MEMIDGQDLVIYVDYDIEQYYKNISDVKTEDGVLSFQFFDERRNTKFQAKFDMGKILGIVYKV